MITKLCVKHDEIEHNNVSCSLYSSENLMKHPSRNSTPVLQLAPKILAIDDRRSAIDDRRSRRPAPPNILDTQKQSDTSKLYKIFREKIIKYKIIKTYIISFPLHVQ